MNNYIYWELIKATYETIYMVFVASFFSIALGLGLALLLYLTKHQFLFKNKFINSILDGFINVTRSIPFIILMICVLPFTRLIIGTTIGTNAAIVPLTLAAIPFFARLAEGAFSELPQGLIETGQALGMKPSQFICKILIPECLPQLIRAMTLTIIGLIGYSAMAGALGGGGLGELAINYGYQRFNFSVTFETVIILVLIVQLVQSGGDYLANHRKFKPLLIGSLFFAMLYLLLQLPFVMTTQDNNTIRVGITAGWSEQVMTVAKKVAAEQYHLNLQIVTFNDYILPNSALADGSIDANIFQHVPYLNAQIKADHYQLIPIAKTFIYPMGFYSSKIHQISELPQYAIVALPNDPSNLARSLLLLQNERLIKLKPGAGPLCNLKDIVENPKNLRFKLLDAAQLPRVLKDADLVAITNDYVQAAGLSINQALFKEGKDSLYANVIVIRKKDQNDPAFQELIQVMHSKQVIDKTEEIFPHGAAIPAWH